MPSKIEFLLTAKHKSIFLKYLKVHDQFISGNLQFLLSRNSIN